MKRDIHLKWFFPHSVDAVWECITDPALMDQWFMKSNFKPEVGYQFQFRDKPRPGWDGIVYCEVLEIIPNRKVTFNWKGGPRPGVINLDTVVTWTLQPVEGGTELTLDHTGFSGFRNLLVSLMMGQGWKKIMPTRFAKVLKAYDGAKI